MGNRTNRELPLESRLRATLQARVRAAPMPAGLLDVPDSWTRPARGTTFGMVAAIGGTVAAAAIAIVLLVQLSGLSGPVNRTVPPAAAARLVGVPVTQVVQTRDGAIVAEVTITNEVQQMRISLVTTGEDGYEAHPLAVFPMPQFRDNSATVWGDFISCSPARGMAQPNLLVGGSSPDLSSVDVSVPARTIVFDRFMVSVLEAPTIDVDEVELEMSASAGYIAGSTWPGSVFDGADPCLGEEIGPRHEGAPEWGPLALVAATGDMARTEGTAVITATCVFLERDGERALLVWPEDRTRWNPGDGTIRFMTLRGAEVTVRSGQNVVLAGSGAGDGDEDWQGSVLWTREPKPECDAEGAWFVTDFE